MLYRKWNNKIRDLFGFEMLETGAVNDTVMEDGSIEKSSVLYYWIAEISCFQPLISEDEVVIAVVKTDKWLKGLLIISTPGYEEFNKPVDVSVWDDPVPEALVGINVFPEKYRAVIFGDSSYQFGLEVHTPSVSGSMLVNGPVIDKSINQLWESLCDSVRHLAKTYNKESLLRYVGLA